MFHVDKLQHLRLIPRTFQIFCAQSVRNKCGKSLFKRKGGMLVCLDESCGFEKKAERKSKKKDDAE